MIKMCMNNYSPFNNFVLRSPLLPFETINKINNNFLKEIASSGIFQEAIYLASPLLYDELQKWQKGKIAKPKEEKRLRYTLLRYLIRMSSRCTPFGLFAGCTSGEITQEKSTIENSRIFLAAQNKYKKNFTIHVLHQIALS